MREMTRALSFSLLSVAAVVALSGAALATPQVGLQEQSDVKLISQEDLLEKIDADEAPMILDVRTLEEFNEGHVPGAIHIPYDELAERLAEIESAREKRVVVYCRSGRRAGIAEELLQKEGFGGIMHLEGDMLAWIAAGLPLEKRKQ